MKVVGQDSNEIDFRVSTKNWLAYKRGAPSSHSAKISWHMARIACEAESGSNYSGSGQEENAELNENIDKDAVNDINDADDKEWPNKKGLL